MAVHRKRPLPRYPISGTRLRRRMITLGALLALSSLAPMTADAQEGPAGTLSGGSSAYAAGKYEIAVRQLTAALSSDKIGPNDAAKALYVRGLAYQRLGQSPRAIADLGAAMWLGISPSERLSAMVNRSLAYKAAGQKARSRMPSWPLPAKRTRAARWIGCSPTMAVQLAILRRLPLSRLRFIPRRPQPGAGQLPLRPAQQMRLAELMDHDHPRRSIERQSRFALVGLGPRNLQ